MRREERFALALGSAALFAACGAGDEDAAWTAAVAELRASSLEELGELGAARRPALLPALTEAEARSVFPIDAGGFLYDPWSYFRHPPSKGYTLNWPEHPAGEFRYETNSEGLREDGEVLTRRPDRLVLVTGDSHSDGVCANSESYSNVLQARLAARWPDEQVEVLNAAVGRYCFSNYLGTLVRFLPLHPSVFVLGVFGGNDFAEQLLPAHAAAGTARPVVGGDYARRLDAAQALDDGQGQVAIFQGFNQLVYFKHRPDQAELALESAREQVAEMQRLCREHGVRMVLLYVPPPADADQRELAPLFERLSEALELSPEDLRATDRLAERLLAGAREAGIQVVDGREVFAGAEEPLYWSRDHHIDLAAHARLAAALEPVVAAAAEAAARGSGPAPSATTR